MGKIVLTPQQEKFLIENYPTMPNEALVVHLNISLSTIYRLAHEYGLEKVFKRNKYVLTPENEKYLVAKFQNTFNDELCERLGCSPATLASLARKYGLKKSKQFLHKTQMMATAAATYFHRKRGTFPPKGFQIPNADKYRFKPGHTESAATKKKRIARSKAGRKAMIEKERARILAGLPPRTKLHLNPNAKKETEARYYLVKVMKYRCENMFDMYYDKDTHRSRKYENDPNSRFRFLPAEQ